jgi:protein-S-isoprenylcysteine O-methyltransferase Ste14
MTPMTQLPSLGARGEGWVLAQGLILVLVALAGWLGPAWGGPARVAGVVLGAILILAGATLVVRGSRDLGDALTPLPRPRAGATLVETGVYARVRHPIYGGIVIAAFGWGLLTASIPAIAMAVVAWAFFTVKSMREEAWLVERFPDYPAYRARTRRLIPWIG